MPLIIKSEALVLILVWRFGSKWWNIVTLVMAFYRYIRAFLASKLRKSVLDKLSIVNSKFFVFLDLVLFDFLDLAKFIITNRFSIPLPILLLLVLILALLYIL